MVEKDPVPVVNSFLGISICLTGAKSSYSSCYRTWIRSGPAISARLSIPVSFMEEGAFVASSTLFDSRGITERESFKTLIREESQRKRLFSPFIPDLVLQVPYSVRFWYVPSGSYRYAVLRGFILLGHC